MKIRAFNMAVTALSLLAASTVVVAQPVATPLTQPETVAEAGTGSGPGFIMLALAAVAAGLGVYTAVDSDNDSAASPVSP